MSGADRYGDAQIMLRAIHKEHPEADMTVDQKIALAQVEATLAVAGATALAALLPIVGDGDDVTDWARLIATGTDRGRPLGLSSKARAWPSNWPPRHGEQWRDDYSDLWACLADGRLVCLSDTPGGPRAEDAATIEKRYGPMVRIAQAPVEFTEPPF